VSDKQPNALFYDEAYFASHYGHLLEDAKNSELVAKYFKRTVFDRWVPNASKILDFGAGHGTLSASVAASCYDCSEPAIKRLRELGRDIVQNLDSVSDGYFDAVFSSHVLEHSPDPYQEVRVIRRILASSGKFILILPIEKMPGLPANAIDQDCHFFAWNFQNICNLLMHSGFSIEHQSIFYGPYMLRTLGKWLKPADASKWASRLSALKRQHPSTLTICKPA
jgi:ubiquinone/menaquinone biosynthesis C-methylase UbiE